MKATRAEHSRIEISLPRNAALQLLRTAYELARHERKDAWCLSLRIAALRGIGLVDGDFRWLVRTAYAEHASETTTPGSLDRTFRRTGRLHLTDATCFILTDLGCAFAREVYEPAPRHRRTGLLTRLSRDQTDSTTNNNDTDGSGDPSYKTIPNSATAPRAIPEWDQDLRELRAGGVLVKRFHEPARNQELVLAAFQAASWPRYIDDPFPRAQDRCAKRRLHNTVASLKRCQAAHRIYFGCLGNGTRITWRWI